MKMVLEIDREKALELAQSLEKTNGINNVLFKYSTKKKILK